MVWQSGHLLGLREQERRYWSNCWRKARANMPRTSPSGYGSPMLLRVLVGYSNQPSGKWPVGHGEHVRTAIRRGDRPRSPQRRKLLQMLASTNGVAIAKAIAIRRGIKLDKWKYPPVNESRRVT